MAWLYRGAGSEKWWVGWRANGRQFLKSTGHTDRKKAEEKVREIEHLAQLQKDRRLSRAFVESLTETPSTRITLMAAVEEWWEESKQTTAPRTFEKYDLAGRELLQFLGANDAKPQLEEVTTDESQVGGTSLP